MSIIILDHIFFLCMFPNGKKKGWKERRKRERISHSYFTVRKMTFRLFRHPSAVLFSINKQNITFSFSIHTFLSPGSYFASVESWRVKQKRGGIRNIKIWQSSIWKFVFKGLGKESSFTSCTAFLASRHSFFSSWKKRGAKHFHHI